LPVVGTWFDGVGNADGRVERAAAVRASLPSLNREYEYKSTLRTFKNQHHHTSAH